MKVRGHCNSGASALTVARRTAFSAPNASQRSRTRTRRPGSTCFSPQRAVLDIEEHHVTVVKLRDHPDHVRQQLIQPDMRVGDTEPQHPTGDLRRRQHGSLSPRDTETRGSVGPTGRNPSGSAYRSRCDGTAGIGASEPITASATRAGVRRPAALAFRETGKQAANPCSAGRYRPRRMYCRRACSRALRSWVRSPLPVRLPVRPIQVVCLVSGRTR